MVRNRENNGTEGIGLVNPPIYHIAYSNIENEHSVWIYSFYSKRYPWCISYMHKLPFSIIGLFILPYKTWYLVKHINAACAYVWNGRYIHAFFNFRFTMIKILFSTFYSEIKINSMLYETIRQKLTSANMELHIPTDTCAFVNKLSWTYEPRITRNS